MLKRFCSCHLLSNPLHVQFNSFRSISSPTQIGHVINGNAMAKEIKAYINKERETFSKRKFTVIE